MTHGVNAKTGQVHLTTRNASHELISQCGTGPKATRLEATEAPLTCRKCKSTERYMQERGI